MRPSNQVNVCILSLEEAKAGTLKGHSRLTIRLQKKEGGALQPSGLARPRQGKARQGQGRPISTNPVADGGIAHQSVYIHFAVRSISPFLLRISLSPNPAHFLPNDCFKMKFFGRGKDLATDVAVGGPSDSEITPEKHTPGVVDDNALEHVPSQNVQDGVKKIEAVTLT